MTVGYNIGALHSSFHFIFSMCLLLHPSMGWESALISDWWEVRSEFVQQDGILHAFMTIAAVTHNADKSGSCSAFTDALIRQELNEDGKIKLFEIYKDMSMAREFSTAWKASSTPVPVTRRSRSSKISRVGAADLVGQMLTIVISYLFFHWVYRSYSQVQR